MTDDDICLSCMIAIGVTERKIRCNDACDKFIHFDCSHLTKKAADSIDESENINYTCTCLNFGLRAINNKINGLYNLLHDLIDRDKSRDTEYNEIKKNIIDINGHLKSSKVHNENERDNNSSTSTPRGNGTTPRGNSTTTNGNNSMINRGMADKGQQTRLVCRYRKQTQQHRF